MSNRRPDRKLRVYTGNQQPVYKSKRAAWAARYNRYVQGRVAILSRSVLAKDLTRGQLYRIARQDLRELFIQYAAARKVSYDLFNSSRLRASFMKGVEPEEGKRRLRQAIREARADQAQIRAELTRATGVGLMSLMSAEERIQGES